MIEYSKKIIQKYSPIINKENSFELISQKEWDKKFFNINYTLLDNRGVDICDELCEEIKHLRVSGENRSFTFLKKYLSKMINLHTIGFPAIYLDKINKLSFPESIKSLKIINNSKYNDYFKDNKKNFTVNKLLKNWGLENVSSFEIIHLSNAKPIEDFIEISPKHFPNLEFVKFRVLKSVDFLMQLCAFKTIKHLTLEGVSIDIFPLLRSFSDTLETLRFEGCNEEFSLKGIEEFYRLESIYFNSIWNGIDCRCFLELPRLKEVVIMNSKNIINIESILELTNLEALYLGDNKNVDNKNAINNENKSKFETMRIPYIVVG
ncbi:hypothetical protein [Capnocytophaga gingivalis]|uniref:hypothetical protein n=1 Tax=Capnocytophaga gingivalis TaxID=1017 RepID=UPI0028E66A8A|nr:hypothetical protein [Capnocytophaga gingivalis]